MKSTQIWHGIDSVGLKIEMSLNTGSIMSNHSSELKGSKNVIIFLMRYLALMLGGLKGQR